MTHHSTHSHNGIGMFAQPQSMYIIVPARSYTQVYRHSKDQGQIKWFQFLQNLQSNSLYEVKQFCAHYTFK